MLVHLVVDIQEGAGLAGGDVGQQYRTGLLGDEHPVAVQRRGHHADRLVQPARHRHRVDHIGRGQGRLRRLLRRRRLVIQDADARGARRPQRTSRNIDDGEGEGLGRLAQRVVVKLDRHRHFAGAARHHHGAEAALEVQPRRRAVSGDAVGDGDVAGQRPGALDPLHHLAGRLRNRNLGIGDEDAAVDRHCPAGSRCCASGYLARALGRLDGLPADRQNLIFLSASYRPGGNFSGILYRKAIIQPDFQPCGYPSSCSIRTGRCRGRIPVAWNTALASAALVPTLPSSPMPLMPSGLALSSCSSSTSTSSC